MSKITKSQLGEYNKSDVFVTPPLLDGHRPSKEQAKIYLNLGNKAPAITYGPVSVINKIENGQVGQYTKSTVNNRAIPDLTKSKDDETSQLPYQEGTGKNLRKILQKGMQKN
jgi:hypothetical protein